MHPNLENGFTQFEKDAKWRHIGRIRSEVMGIPLERAERGLTNDGLKALLSALYEGTPGLDQILDYAIRARLVVEQDGTFDYGKTEETASTPALPESEEDHDITAIWDAFNLEDA